MTAGATLGRYQVLNRLGQGGMGEVYLALDTVLDRRVALKLLTVKNHDDPGARKRLVREAKAAAAIDHPYICKIYEAGEDGDRAFIAMEFLEGETLADRLRRGPLAWDEFRTLALESVEALTKAHDLGVAHRDLKPSNIMLTKPASGRIGHVKLVDFGLAKRMATEEAETESALTSPGAVAGTLIYMSPEQFNGLPVDCRTDIFSLGLVFYEALTGAHPFERQGAIPTAMAMLNTPTPPLPGAAAFPLGLEQIVARMLAKPLDQRYQGARELLADLEALDGARPAAAPAGESMASASGAARRDLSSGAAIPSPQRMTVGREKQLAAMRRAYDRVRSGQGLMLAVSGEPGIGKTSLVEDFLAELGANPERPVIARGHCAEQLAGSEAYLPLLEALENLVHGPRGWVVDSVMKTAAPTWYVQVAASGEAPGTTAMRDLPLASQERMKRELAGLFAELGRSRPLVVLIEDLHWADVSTMDLLSFVAARFATMRALVMVTYRPAEMAASQGHFLAVSHDLQSRGFFNELPLSFLGLEDIERYLSRAYPGHAFPPSFAAMIHARTEGSPLFAVDLVRYVHDAGGIREENGKWVLAGSLPDSPKELPASVRGMITRKIERLEAEDRKLLVAASIQGNEFDTAIVAEATDMDPAEVEERLEALERVHVFVRRGEEREFPDRTPSLRYQFVHVLYQNALYASLQPTRRAALSARVARATVTHYGSEIAPIAGRVALLFETARDFAAGAHHFCLAARHAVSLFAFREALGLCDRGLESVRALAGSAEGKQLELGLQMIKGVALRSTTGWATPELEATFSRAREICNEFGEPPQVYPVLWAITLFHLIRGNLIECRTAFGRTGYKSGRDRKRGIPDGRVPYGGRVARIHWRHGGSKPAAGALDSSSRSRAASGVHGDVRSGSGDDGARHVEPAALGAGLSGPGARARAQDGGDRQNAATAADACVRRAGARGHPHLSRRGGGSRGAGRREHRALPRARAAAGSRVEPLVPGGGAGDTGADSGRHRSIDRQPGGAGAHQDAACSADVPGTAGRRAAAGGPHRRWPEGRRRRSGLRGTIIGRRIRSGSVPGARRTAPLRRRCLRGRGMAAQGSGLRARSTNQVIRVKSGHLPGRAPGGPGPRGGWPGSADARLRVVHGRPLHKRPACRTEAPLRDRIRYDAIA